MTTVDPDMARARAQEILDGSKYQPQKLPRPFRGVLEWLADLFEPVVDALAKVFEPIISAILELPGGRFIILAIVGGLVGALVWWLIGRRSRAAVAELERSGLVDLSADPAVLEKEADEAEQAGDFARAVRRRFEAGLIRLVRDERLSLHRDTTARAAALQVADPVMDDLTATFEQVVYGGRAGSIEDVTAARSGWDQLLGVRARR